MFQGEGTIDPFLLLLSQDKPQHNWSLENSLEGSLVSLRRTWRHSCSSFLGTGPHSPIPPRGRRNWPSSPVLGWGHRGHGRPLPSYHVAWGTSAAPGDAVAVGAILAGAGQPAAIAVEASRAGLVAVVARPAWLAGASASHWVAAEQLREG